MAPVPTEIRDMILEEVHETCLSEHCPTAAFASVCRVWQEFFEAKHFWSLVVTAKRLAEFDKIVVGERRQLVHHICVNVPVCWAPEWVDDIFFYVMTTLFASLSTWDRNAAKVPGLPSLEIRTNYSVVYNTNINDSRKWAVVPCPTPQRSALSRIPEVKAIKTLEISNSTYHIFQNHPRSLHQLLRSLPSLEKVIYENYSRYMESKRAGPSSVYETMLQSLPTSVTEVVLFEDASAVFAPYSMFGYNAPARTVDSASVGLCLARASQQLQHLSASFVVDAKHFFSPFWPCASNARAANPKGWHWSKLETLALTSELLRGPHAHHGEVNDLLQAISMAVREMPKMRTLEIWNGNGNNHACLSRYSYSPDSRKASLTWKGTWGINITQQTARSWAETVRQKTGLEGVIRVERIRIFWPIVAEWVALLLELRDRVATEKAKHSEWVLSLDGIKIELDPEVV